MQIILDPKEPAIFEAEILNPAIQNTIGFMARSEVMEAFRSNIEDFDEEAYDKGLEETYTLKVIQQKGQIMAFCCVYPIDEPLSLFFNPVLLVNMMRAVKMWSEQETKEEESAIDTHIPKRAKSSPAEARRPCASRAEFVKQLVLFVTVKLVHALMHLLHIVASPQVKADNTTPPRIKVDIMVGPSEKRRKVSYSDFGTMLERDILGGCWELSSSLANLFMVPEYIVVYPSIDTMVGRYLDAAKSSIDENGANVQLYGVHRAKFVPTFVTSMLKGGYARMAENVKVGSSKFDEQWAECEEEGTEEEGESAGGYLFARL